MAGLYIHIPFCVRKCGYCDFYSEPGRLSSLDDFLGALMTEAGQYRGMCFDTLYIGGGTPSILGAGALGKMMRGLSGCLGLTGLSEATIEANPDTADEGFLRTAAECGISRISIGVQSLNDDELTKCGRLHDAGQALEAIDTARACGFADISADIIIGLPGQTLKSLEETLHSLVISTVTHISAYCLSVEPRTEFARHPPQGLPDDDAQAGLYEFAARYLKDKGYLHYEISNFALPGRQCRHNLNYWRGGDYLGLGPGAASHLRGRRYKNSADLDKYIANPLSVKCDAEELEAEAKAGEEAMLRLRLLEEGLDTTDLAARYGYSNTASLQIRLNKLAEDKMLERAGTHYRLPPGGVLTSNRVFIEIIS